MNKTDIITGACILLTVILAIFRVANIFTQIIAMIGFYMFISILLNGGNK